MTEERPGIGSITAGVVNGQPDPDHPDDKETAEKIRVNIQAMPKDAVVWIPDD